MTKVFVLGGLFELERRVPYAELRLLCAASLERAAYLRGRAGNIMSSASRVGPSLGARVDVVWKDVELFAVRSWRARTRASAGYCCDDDDCATRSGGAAVEDAEADGGPRNTRARTGGMQDVHSNVIAGAGGGNVNMLQQQLPHFLMLCGAATEQKRALPHCCPAKT